MAWSSPVYRGICDGTPGCLRSGRRLMVEFDEVMGARGVRTRSSLVISGMIAVRVSDRERNSVVARLGDAAAEGRLTLAEFDERCGLAYAAATSEQLAALVVDLPKAKPERPDASWVSIVALVAGLAWMPLFPYLDYAGWIGAAGILLGFYEIRRGSRRLSHFLALSGLLGGAVGVALQVFSILFMMLR